VVACSTFKLRRHIHFQAAKVPVKEYEFDQNKLANVQSHLVLFLLLHLYDQYLFYIKLQDLNWTILIIAGKVGSQ
jgi:hypothetical protein